MRIAGAAGLACRTVLGDNGHDGRNEHEADHGGRDVPRRSAADPRLGRGNRGAVELRAARESPERGGRDAEAQGVLRRRARRPGRGPSRFRALHREAGPAGPPARGTGSGARRRRGEVFPRGHRGTGGARAGDALLGPLSPGAGDQPARVRPRRSGPGRWRGDAGVVPVGRERRSVRPPAGASACIRAGGRRGSGRVSLARTVPPGRARRAEGPGVAARVLRPRRSRAGRSGR